MYIHIILSYIIFCVYKTDSNGRQVFRSMGGGRLMSRRYSDGERGKERRIGVNILLGVESPCTYDDEDDNSNNNNNIQTVVCVSMCACVCVRARAFSVFRQHKRTRCLVVGGRETVAVCARCTGKPTGIHRLLRPPYLWCGRGGPFQKKKKHARTIIIY